MALINCPECKKEVSDTIQNCIHCGYQIKQHRRIPKKKDNSILIMLVIVGILLVTFIILNHGEDYPPVSSPTSAYYHVEIFVKKQLKSPSTAKFPSEKEKDKHTNSLGFGKYKIDSWVDSQNSFGATIRTKFSCSIVFEGNKVRCEQFKFY
jgi:hypothetical protein